MPSASWLNGWVTGDVVTAAEFKKGVGSVSDTTLGVSAASVNITGLPTTYANLLIVAYLRGDTAATSIATSLRFNGDSGANYDAQAFTAHGATLTGSESLAATGIVAGDCPAASATANVFSACMIVVPNYGNASNNKSATIQNAMKQGTTTGLIWTEQLAGFWRSSSAINQITLLPTTGNFVAGSRVSIYAMGS